MDARGGRATSGAGRSENGHSFDRAETAADGVGDRHPQEQAKGRRSDPNQLERQLMQELRDAGWVKAAALPPFPKTIEGLLSKGWIERRGGGNDTCYRLTDEGLAAKMAPLRIYD
jgi:hypothetical protein